VHVYCKLTQFHTPRGSMIQFSGDIYQVASLREEFRIPKLTFYSDLWRRAVSRRALSRTSSCFFLENRLDTHRRLVDREIITSVAPISRS